MTTTDTNPDFESTTEQLVMERVVPKEDDLLTTITNLGRRLVALEAEQAEKAKELERLTEEIRDIAEKRLPDLLGAVGLEEIRLTDGRKIQTKVEYFAAIPKDKATEAYAWLRSKNMGGVIKEGLVVPVSQKEYLTSVAVPFELNESIHHSTLRALVKEQIEAGNEFPRELFGVHVANKVVVK